MAKMHVKKGGVLIILGIVSIAAVAVFLTFFSQRVAIESIELSSPNNSALLEDIKVHLDKPSRIHVEYWNDGSEKVRTPITGEDQEHQVTLVLLKPNTTYHYRVVIDRFFRQTSKDFTFKTGEIGSWMKHNWVKDDRPHDADALDDGLVMLCYGGTPGYVAMVDGKGDIRWYWQCDTMGVRMATITPRNTVLVLLHPEQLDEINDVSDAKEIKKLNELKFPIRRGRIGYTGGTAFAEIDLSGKELWRVNIDPNKDGYESLHHEIRMDSKNRILSLIREPIEYNLSGSGDGKKDTLWGDAVVRLDTTGKILWKWSTWNDWDFQNDSLIDVLSYDRFHLNAIWITDKDDYLLSSAIENQIWYLDSKLGKLKWKLGKGGSFKMNNSDYFYFQHNVNQLSENRIMLFDNGDNSPFDTTGNKLSFTRLYNSSDKGRGIGKSSRVLTFDLNTTNWKASLVQSVALPQHLYTSRMGSAYELPNKNILTVSSKTGMVLILDTTGKVLWELNSYFIPYRAEYVPEKTWNKYLKFR